MRKTSILLLFCLLIVVILGILPAIEGHLFKQNLLQLIDIINRDGRMRATLVSYDQGWFKSNATVQFEKVRPSGGPPVAIEIQSFIAHGPLVKNYDTGSYTFAAASINSNVFANLPRYGRSASLLEINTLASLTGKHWQNAINRPGFNRSLAGSTLNWNGLKGYINFSIGNGLIQHLSSKFTVGALQIQSGGMPTIPLQTLMIDPITYENQTEQRDVGLWTGSGSLTFPGLLAVLRDGKQVQLNMLVFTTAVNIPSQSLINFTTDISLQKLQLPIDLPVISPATFSLSIENLNSSGLRETSAYLATLKSNPPKDESEILNLIPKVITPTTLIRKNLSITTPLGMITSQLEANIPPNTPAPITLDVIKQKANLTINIRAAIPLVEKLISFYAASTVQIKPQTSVSSQTSANDDLFNQYVAQLLKSGKINLTISMQLIGYHDQNLSPEIFAVNVDKLNLPIDVATQLKSQYLTLYKQNQALQAQNANQTALNSPEMQQQTTIAMVKQVIASWLQQGYIVQDKNDYVISVTRSNGQMILNGKPMPEVIPPLLPIPQNTPATQNTSVPKSLPPAQSTPATQNLPTTQSVPTTQNTPAPAAQNTPAAQN